VKPTPRDTRHVRLSSIARRYAYDKIEYVSVRAGTYLSKNRIHVRYVL